MMKKERKTKKNNDKTKKTGVKMKKERKIEEAQ